MKKQKVNEAAKYYGLTQYLVVNQKRYLVDSVNVLLWAELLLMKNLFNQITISNLDAKLSTNAHRNIEIT